MRRSLSLLCLLTSLLLPAACAPPRDDRAVASAPLPANDNRVAAGVLRNGVLTLHLVVVEGTWQAEHALPAWRMLAFAEAGRPATTPGPLLRVPLGTVIDVRVDNRSGSDLSIHGLHARAGTDAPLQLAAHGSARARFAADTAGTFFYWGTLGKPLDERFGRDSELNGAFVVDADGAHGADRIFVLTRHGAKDEGGDGVGAWAINGRSWPQTERLDYRVGETVVWRLINASEARHPMHLHGAYFRVTATSDNLRTAGVAVERQATEATHSLLPGETADLVWSPRRPGNWLFHCHILFHVMPENRIPEPLWYDEYADLPHDEHMAGLVLGIRVRDGAGPERPGAADAPRHVDLRIGERGGVDFDAYFGRHVPGVGYGVDGAAITSPGEPIVLERGRPVEVAIRNELTHATAVHWHGIELDSYYDGVPHWGTDGTRVTPLIEAGGTFVARFTPPRSGTFIYHTHFNDYAQLTGGLYGALIVVEPGARFDPAHDHVYVIGQGPDDGKDPILLNGSAAPAAATWRGLERHRLRLVGISAVSTVRVRLLGDDGPVSWRPLAKDGADLPAALTRTASAELTIAPGETFDFEYAADAPAQLRLEAAARADRPAVTRAEISVER